MSEQDFNQINGNSYRGSRYANFSGGGTTPQGNVSSAATANSTTQVANSTAPSTNDNATAAAPTTPSPGLTSNPSAPKTPSLGSAAIGAALPYAGYTIGGAAGAAMGAGANFSDAIGEGVSSLAGKASGGLIGATGAGATATDSALSSMGGQFGPATPTAVNAASGGGVGNLGSGANLGAAAGAGLFTAAAVLLQGGGIKNAATAGLGTAAGTAIGNAILPGVGGFVGGFIGGTIFCFTPETLVLMEDGTKKAIGDLVLGDVVMAGGKVMACGRAYADAVFLYKGTFVVGTHAVFEDGKWIRVQDSVSAVPAQMGEQPVVIPVATENHIILTPYFISADIFEVEPDPARGYSEAERIEILNSDQEIIAKLVALEALACKGKTDEPRT